MSAVLLRLEFDPRPSYSDAKEVPEGIRTKPSESSDEEEEEDEIADEESDGAADSTTDEKDADTDSK